MTGVSLTAKLSDFERGDRILSAVINGRTQDLMAILAEHVLAETHQNFMHERTPEGEPWEKSQRAASEAGRTLQDTRRLFQSYTYQAYATMAEIGTNVIYAAIHHFGGNTGRGHAVTLPARPALGITSEIQGEMQQLYTDWMGGLFND